MASSSLPCTSISPPKASISNYAGFISQRGYAHFDQWNGLKNLCITSISQYSVKTEKKRKYRGKGVYASLVGVGAPEALVIGVVALLVFGPKGLAEAARNIGQALRGIQPTIRELQEVSREFKTSLEREIGLDEIDYTKPRSSSYNNATTSPVIKNTPVNYDSPENLTDKSTSEVEAYSADDYLKFTEAQLKAALSKIESSPQDTPTQNPEDISRQESVASDQMTQSLDPKPEAEEA